MVDAVRAAVEGGATIVQLREKDLDAAAYVQLARDVLEVTRPAGVPLLINDRVDVALAAGAFCTNDPVLPRPLYSPSRFIHVLSPSLALLASD